MDVVETSDAELLSGMANGDKGALAGILRRHSPAVTRYAWALVANQHDVEEVVQDTFLTCWRKADSIDVVDRSLLPWLLLTCRNLALNLNRSRARHAADELPDDIVILNDDDEARDRLRWVTAEIERLSPLDRRVCELCLIEGRTYAEAAEATGISVGAVRQRVSRSRSKLRKAAIDNEN
ncbi:RNA polymerase sigma factor [Herbiconiux ginsengi]|uniref:RNA polymerase sigma-70 factor, ECF subfamily n=1 Tax=Herbiconiux ginsengi TaxID=381665 RepID=A0A1H3S3N3_9MICO|nr:sigma-70 family RNA polymerase sigma factor [Herbiconiux ginsengi]SDZ32542.1 RNA polymerase sigma-70 factor, ECF subfamily [Herbiconiux ginsengi]